MTRKQSDNWGGARVPGLGKKLGPPRATAKLTDEARRHLRKVWRARVMREPGLTEDEIVNSAIMALAEQPADDWNGDVL